MEELINLTGQLIGLLEGSYEGFEQLWDIRAEISRLIYLAGMECVPLISDWEGYNRRCEVIKDTLENDICSPEKYLATLKELKGLLEEYKEKYSYYAELNEREMTWSTIHENQKMKMTTIRLSDEYRKFIKMIECGQNFAIIRCGDGEYSLMNGIGVHAQENWTAPSELTNLGKAIRESIEYTADNYYYGISCPCCDPKAYFWYLNNVGNHVNITFANLWVNCNYKNFVNDFLNIKRDTVLIANHRAKDKQIGNLNILKHYPISDDCVSFWEEDALALIENIRKDYGDRKGLLYAVAAGPMSGPIIQKLYEYNPDNCYIDFGSCLDPWFHETTSRAYMIPGSVYAERDCFMPDPRLHPYPRITAVMTLYKRPESLLRQLEAIEEQTIKPYEIILFQDAIQNGIYNIQLEEEIKKRYSNIMIAESNQGVWGRFKYASEAAKGDYICIFDDDTIPGKRWFENCYMHMIQNEGIYGTVGIGMLDHTGYPLEGEFSKYWRFGWPNPMKNCMEVDFAGHAWFITKEHLKKMIEESYEFCGRHKYEGEDAFLSYANSKDGVRTIIPPHYLSNLEFWGSTSKDFGTEKYALSLNRNNLRNMGNAVNELVEKGWNTIQYRAIEYLVSYVAEENRNRPKGDA